MKAVGNIAVGLGSGIKSGVTVRTIGVKQGLISCWLGSASWQLPLMKGGFAVGGLLIPSKKCNR